jgi:hypothetical protein
MKTITSLLLVLAYLFGFSSAFAPPTSQALAFRRSTSRIFINIGEQERQKLTRDSEPEEYFRTYVSFFEQVIT